jgi:hypothetical protein
MEPVLINRISRGSHMGSQQCDPNESVEQVGANDQQVGKGVSAVSDLFHMCFKQCFRPVGRFCRPVSQTCGKCQACFGSAPCSCPVDCVWGETTTANRRLSNSSRVWCSFDFHILIRSLFHTPCFRPLFQTPCFRPLFQTPVSDPLDPTFSA